MRIVGLDIGSYSIKGVAIDVGFRQLELLSFFEEKLPQEVKTETIQKTLQSLFVQNYILPSFKIVSAVNGTYVSSRFITLPFSDKTKVAQTLPFELEEHIPFGLDQIIFDHHIVLSEDKSSKVLVLFTPKEVIQKHLSLFEGLDMSPEILTSGASALSNLTSLEEEGSKEMYAMVDIGHTQTSVCVIEDSSIRLLRTLSCAGKVITETIQQDYSLSYEEAQKAKIENGFVLTDQTKVTKDQIRFSDCIKKSLTPLITHLNQTFQSLRTEGKGMVRKVFMTGGTSLLRNLGHYLSNELQLEVEHLKCLNAFTMNHIAVTDENNAKASMALALSLGFVGQRHSEQFNFRKNEFSRTQGGLLGKEMKYFLVLGGIVLAILFTHIIAHTVILSTSFNHIQSELTALAKKFPIDIPLETLNHPTQLRAYLNKQEREHKEKIEALGGQKREGLTPLGVIKEISSMVPKKVLFDVRELMIVENHIKIKAISDSFNSIDNMEKSFRNNSNFTAVTKGTVSTASDGTHKEFTFTFDIKKRGEK